MEKPDLKRMCESFSKKNINEANAGSKSLIITLPFLDLNNNFITIYIKKQKNMFILSDNSHCLKELEFLGVNLKTKNKKLNEILNKYGIIIEKQGELYTSCFFDCLPFKLYMLASCIVKIYRNINKLI